MKIILLIIVAVEAAVLGFVFFAIPDVGAELGELRWIIPLAIVGVTVLTMAPFLAMSKKFDSAMRQFTGRSDPAYAGAPIGIGTILDLSMSGLSINDVQQYLITFEVETLDGAIFTATCRQLITPQELASVTQGTMLAVTYRPDRPGEVQLTDPSRAAEAQQVLQQIRTRKGLADPDAMLIAHHGIPATGIVVATTPTGEVLHGHSGMDLAVLVTRPDGSQFTGYKRSYLLPRQLSGVQVGSQVGVHYLAEDESRLTISLPVNG